MKLKFKFDVHLESGFMTCTDRQQPSDFEAFAKKKKVRIAMTNTLSLYMRSASLAVDMDWGF